MNDHRSTRIKLAKFLVEGDVVILDGRLRPVAAVIPADDGKIDVTLRTPADDETYRTAPDTLVVILPQKPKNN